MNDFLKYTIQVEEDQKEIILAFLSLLNTDMIEEMDAGYALSFEIDDQIEDSKKAMQEVLNQFDLAFQVETVKGQNWNAVWEASFQPIYVHDYAQIRASFHPSKSNFKHDLLIDPQMSFGTGHHATTYMMVEQMEGLDLLNKSVMDYGCGTGILAILAAKEGAKPIVAFDIEQNAYENSVSNAKINAVEHISLFQGVLSDIPQESAFDIILANINRNVILDSLGQLSELINKGGLLLVSGILIKDFDTIVSQAKIFEFNLVKRVEKDGWLCLQFNKN